MTQITIDRDVCFGSGECVLAAPGVFELDDIGIARIKSDAPELDPGDMQGIVANCPSGALTTAGAEDAKTEVSS